MRTGHLAGCPRPFAAAGSVPLGPVPHCEEGAPKRWPHFSVPILYPINAAAALESALRVSSDAKDKRCSAYRYRFNSQVLGNPSLIRIREGLPVRPPKCSRTVRHRFKITRKSTKFCASGPGHRGALPRWRQQPERRNSRRSSHFAHCILKRPIFRYAMTRVMSEVGLTRIS